MTRAEFEAANGAVCQAAGSNDPQWNVRYLQALKDNGLKLVSSRPRGNVMFLDAPRPVNGPEAYPTPMFVVKANK